MRGFQVVGHRGAKDEAPENTLPGFAYAKRLGLQAIELDVRLTRDAQLAVIHDATVDRTTDATGPVEAFTAAELARLDARAGCPSWPDPTGVPTLDQVLDMLDDMPLIQIEIKKDSNERMKHVARMVVEHIRQRGIESRVIVSSFEEVAVEAVGRVAPDLRRAFIGAYDTDEYVDTALRLGCTQADMSLERSSIAMVERAHRLGMRVVGFQCNSPEALQTCLDWGVDAATSDVPSTILPLLAKRPVS